MSKTDFILAFRNVFRQKVRSVVILTTISICGFVLLILGGLYNSLFEMVEKEQISESGHINIVLEQNLNNDSLIPNYNILKSEILKDSNVSEIISKRVVSGLVGYEDRTALFSGEIIESEVPGGVILGKILAENLGINSGDDINFLVGWNGFTLKYTKSSITASAESDRVYASLPWEAIKNFDNPNSVSSISIILKDQSLIEYNKISLNRIFKEMDINVSITTFNDNKSHFSSVKNIYMSNYYFIVGVIILTIFFAIFNTITMAIMERIREFGTLQSFGLTLNKIKFLLLIEGLILGLFGFVLSGGTAFLFQGIINIKGGLRLPPPPTVENSIIINSNIPISSLILTFIVLIVVTITATFFSTTRISKLSVIQKLNHI